MKPTDKEVLDLSNKLNEELRQKLAAVEQERDNALKACSEHRETIGKALSFVKRFYIGPVSPDIFECQEFREFLIARANSNDCGKDFVRKSELESEKQRSNNLYSVAAQQTKWREDAEKERDELKQQLEQRDKKVAEMKDILRSINEQLLCPSRNTTMSSYRRDGSVIISSDLRARVAACMLETCGTHYVNGPELAKELEQRSNLINQWTHPLEIKEYLTAIIARLKGEKK